MQKVFVAEPLREFIMTVYIDGFLQGDIKHWPANIVEPILEKLEALEKKNGFSIEIVQSYCSIDYGVHIDKNYIYVRALEIRPALLIPHIN